MDIYFWNSEINAFTKSYLFPSKTYTCEFYEKAREVSVPLPERTVFHGRSDACSPHYSTYSSNEAFHAFYSVSLDRLMGNGVIQDYAIEKNDSYAVYLHTGAYYVIEYRERSNAKRNGITIKYIDD